MLRIVSIVEQKIASCSFEKLFIILFSLMIIKVGVWEMPNLGSSIAIAQNPFTNAFRDTPAAQYLMYSWFSSFIAWILHLKNLTRFFLFHLCCSLGFIYCFARMLRERLNIDNAKKALILFFLFPFSATSFFWVGIDSVTLLLMILSLYFYQKNIVTFLFAVLLGLQHFEQGLISAMALMFPVFIYQYNGGSQEYRFKHVFIYFSGILIGKLILFCIFKCCGIELVSNRALLAKTTLSEYLKQFILHFQVILWSILGVGWLVLIRFYQISRAQWPVLLSIFGVFLCITPMIGDQTRVDCIILFPIIYVYILSNVTFLNRLSFTEVSRWLILWLIIPWIWVWGHPLWSAFPYDVAYILHLIFHHMPLPSNLWIWPFL